MNAIRLYIITLDKHRVTPELSRHFFEDHPKLASIHNSCFALEESHFGTWCSYICSSLSESISDFTFPCSNKFHVVNMSPLKKHKLLDEQCDWYYMTIPSRDKRQKMRLKSTMNSIPYAYMRTRRTRENELQKISRIEMEKSRKSSKLRLRFGVLTKKNCWIPKIFEPF